MSEDREPMTRDEVRTIRHLLRILGIRSIQLDKEEIQILVPDQKRIESYVVGSLSFPTRSVNIQDPHRARRRYPVLLEEHHDFGEPPRDYGDQVDWHFATVFNLLINKFGFDWLVDKLVEKMAREYDALSQGQAEAVIMKYLSRTRGESAMNSTTRTQIHRLRQKILKYKKLVDAFEQLMFNEADTLEEIAARLPPHLVHGQGPHQTAQGVVNTDITGLTGVVSEIGKAPKLKKVPKRETDTSDIEATRKALVQKGWDPDYEEGSSEVDPNGPYGGYRFFCQWCEHSEPYELDDEGMIKPKQHHNTPMFLKMPRKKSDY